jgi:hypothetical protein
MVGYLDDIRALLHMPGVVDDQRKAETKSER